MKSRWRTVRLFVLTANAMCILAIPAFAEEKSGTVTIEEKGIILHPGTKISQTDTKALNEVLKKYDKSLYKIDIYRNGEKKKSLGQLSDVYLDRTVVAEAAAATGNANRTLQVIAATNPQRPSAPIPSGPQMQSPMPAGPQMQSPMPAGPQMQSPMPAGPQMQSPMPAGPQMQSPVPSGPQMSPRSGKAAGPQQSPIPVKPGDDKVYKQLIERLKPILEKYSK